MLQTVSRVCSGRRPEESAYFFTDRDVDGTQLTGDKAYTVTLTISVQHQPPDSDKMTNWLPAPHDEFSLFVRLYWPTDAALNGDWSPPPLRSH